ncbi:MAG: ORF6N domain-containing protein [Candidatus Peregrinibacteria bacterium]|nr:ORF6N domain-containing protein [Candidatus Peregrinibacteria bacterium]
MNEEFIESVIYVIRGHRVMLDEDLAKLYGVEVRFLNQTVKRNGERFPDDFLFQLNEQELFLRSQNVISNENEKNLRSQFAPSRDGPGGRRYLPYAFTEQGVAMLSGLLRSPQAVAVNIEIMRAFVRMRQMLRSQDKLGAEMETLKSFVLKNSQQNTAEFKRVWKAIDELSKPPENYRKIGFNLESSK